MSQSNSKSKAALLLVGALSILSTFWFGAAAPVESSTAQSGSRSERDERERLEVVIRNAVERLERPGKPGEYPSAGCWGADRHDELLLAAEWPHPRFRDVLLKLLKDASEPRFVATLLLALSDYDQEEVDAVARRFTEDHRFAGYDYAPFTVADAARAVLEPARPVDPFKPVPALLPRIWLQDLPNVDVNRMQSGQRHMTIPVALDALNHPSLSVRLQAWLWLAARHGIVIGVTPLREAWPRLTERAREVVLSSLLLYGYRFRTNTKDLATFLDGLLADWDRLTPKQRHALLPLAGRMGIPAARQRALAIIEAAEKRADARPAATQSNDARERIADQLQAAFEAFGPQVTDEDLPRLLRWAQSRDPMIRAGAGYALAALDDWRAVYVVMAHLANPVRDTGWFTLDASDGIHDLVPCCEPARWAYIRCAVRLLAVREKHFEPRDATAYGLSLVRLLEALTGYQTPDEGIPTMRFLRREEFGRIVRWWQRWLKEHDPGLVQP